MSIKHLFADDRPSLLLDFANSKTIDPRITFTRSSTATYVDDMGIIKTAALNDGRIDHDPATGDCLGFLIEEQRTNAWTNSVFTQTSDWLTSNPGDHGTVSANQAVAPDGTTTAAALAAGGQTDRVVSMPLNTTNNQTIFSIFVKRGTGDNLQLGSLAWTSQGSIDYTFSTDTWGTNFNLEDFGKQDYGNGWVRFWIRFGSSGSPDFGTVYVRWGDSSPSGTTGWFWGAQKEQGFFPTSYIPTSGSTVTRQAESAKISGTNFSDWFNSSEGTFVARMAAKTPAEGFIADVGNNSTVGSAASGYILKYTAANNEASGDTRVNDASTAFINVSVTGSNVDLAYAYKENNFNIAVNGTLGTADTSGAVPTLGAQQVFLGSRFNSQAIVNTPISRFAYYNTRLPDTTLEALTK